MLRIIKIPIIIILIATFMTSLVVHVDANEPIFLPKPGMRVALSPTYNPPMLKGIKVDPNHPFHFDFILDPGDSDAGDSNVGNRHAYSIQDESTKLIKYFLASLTTPEKDLWVNLSPYENDRIIPKSFGQTEMGRDLLAQDYVLKQITASLMYPEEEFGKQFWAKIYAEAAKKFGTTQVSVNTFNKVWIVPEKAVVFENKGTAYVVESRLKVMLEEDYLASKKNNVETQNLASLSKQIIQEIIIPALTKEVNEGKNFAQLRQVYSSLILATWYKSAIGGSASGGKNSILSQVYTNKNKTKGLEYANSTNIENIYAQYLVAFKKGVFNYISAGGGSASGGKEDLDPATGKSMPRKYFSGGFAFDGLKQAFRVGKLNLAMLSNPNLLKINANAAMHSTSGDGAFLKRSIDVKWERVENGLPVAYSFKLMRNEMESTYTNVKYDIKDLNSNHEFAWGTDGTLQVKYMHSSSGSSQKRIFEIPKGKRGLMIEYIRLNFEYKQKGFYSAFLKTLPDNTVLISKNVLNIATIISILKEIKAIKDISLMDNIKNKLEGVDSLLEELKAESTDIASGKRESIVRFLKIYETTVNEESQLPSLNEIINHSSVINTAPILKAPQNAGFTEHQIKIEDDNMRGAIFIMSQRPEPAMITEPNTGGIDLTSDRLDVDVRKGGEALDWNFDHAQMVDMELNGLSPQIIKITPVNLKVFLGVTGSGLIAGGS